MIYIYIIALILSSCTKREVPGTNQAFGTSPSATNPPPPPPPPNPVSCGPRPVISAKLVQIGVLSEGRIGLVSATAGNKIVFAGGIVPGAYSSKVDIYDMVTDSWSTAELTIPERQGMAVATLNNKIFFAGGANSDWIDVTSRVDIYDVTTNTWSTAELSKARSYLAAATFGDKVFFAGGAYWGPISPGSNMNYFVGSDVVDIYDNATNSWSTARLSEGRYELSATTVGKKIFFAGGLYNIFDISNKIDVFDAETNSWSVSQLREPKAGHASFAWDNKICWAGGAQSSYQAGYVLSSLVEIKDISTGNSSFDCITPKSFFKAERKGDKIIFFTGNYRNDSVSGTQFEIYNTTTNQWSTGVLDKKVNDATIICVNNTIYVAGGRNEASGPYFNEVWKLEF